jgi:hypothetical protein
VDRWPISVVPPRATEPGQFVIRMDRPERSAEWSHGRAGSRFMRSRRQGTLARISFQRTGFWVELPAGGPDRPARARQVHEVLRPPFPRILFVSQNGAMDR